MPHELANAPQDRTNDWRVGPSPRCKGCGGISHGSVNVGIMCLETSLALVRAQVKALRAQLTIEDANRPAFERFLKLRAEIQALPPLILP